MVHQDPCPQPAHRTGRPRHPVDPIGDGPHRDRSRRRDVLGLGSRTGAARLRHRELLVRRPRAARFSRRSPRRFSATWAIAHRRRSACPRGAPTSAFRSHRPRSNAKSAASSRKPKGWRVDLDDAGADDSSRGDAGSRLLFFRQGAGRRRAADRDGRSRGVSAVGRHRFAGRGLPDDAARLLACC